MLKNLLSALNFSEKESLVYLALLEAELTGVDVELPGSFPVAFVVGSVKNPAIATMKIKLTAAIMRYACV